jgi:acyl carrier protein
MGQTVVTAADLMAALLTAMRRVVPRHVTLSETTALDRAGVDSLALIEVMVHLEAIMGLVFDEDVVHEAVLQPDYRPSMTIEEFAKLLLGLVQREKR